MWCACGDACGGTYVQWNTHITNQGQTVCYKQKFVISKQFPIRYCSSWLRSLLYYIKKNCYRGVCHKSVPLYVHMILTLACTTADLCSVSQSPSVI